MKTIVLVIAFITSVGLNAQTTAKNFTKNDCNTSANHDLFSELDQGTIVVMDFVMAPSCAPCISASHFIEPIVNSYAGSNPGKVKFFSIAFNNTYSCATMNTWAANNSIGSTLFTQGASEVSYYGGMGMPTVVVVGNASHDVYYKQVGFSNSDTTTIRAAIDQGLTVSGIKEPLKDTDVSIFPVPASNNMTVTLKNGATPVKTELFDMTGKMVFRVLNSNKLNITDLPEGLFFIRIENNSGEIFIRKFAISR